MSEREPRDCVCVRSEGLREDERESNFFECSVWMSSVRRVENLRKGGQGEKMRMAPVLEGCELAQNRLKNPFRVLATLEIYIKGTFDLKSFHALYEGAFVAYGPDFADDAISSLEYI
ncbi:putative aldehyde oxidase 2-like protein [Corchorus olitorius]|uniref:Aldehyde oxidase 2-like protein n=1 Tax=Corchorus olitorius TaxID=93759 RepID=A0A1R3G541_9ROSI|nr:putative aldehyde oxidase 2-like protein [Corchorus olitorius]